MPGGIRELDIVGVGYRAELRGKQVVFALGYSHSVVFDVPTGIDIAIEKQTHLTVTGVNRQLVGQVAADVRLRQPRCKQKGVRYTGEVLKKGKRELNRDRRSRSRQETLCVSTLEIARANQAAAAEADFGQQSAPSRLAVLSKPGAHLRAGHRRPHRQDAARHRDHGAALKSGLSGSARQRQGRRGVHRSRPSRSGSRTGISQGGLRIATAPSGTQAVADAAREAGLEF